MPFNLTVKFNHCVPVEVRDSSESVSSEESSGKKQRSQDSSCVHKKPCSKKSKKKAKKQKKTVLFSELFEDDKPNTETNSMPFDEEDAEIVVVQRVTDFKLLLEELKIEGKLAVIITNDF